MIFLSKLFILILMSQLGSAALAAEFVLIANPSLNVSALPAIEVKKIFTGEKQSLGDTKVRPSILSTGEAANSFFQFLDMNANQFELLWVKRELSGNGSAPEKIATAEKMIEYVTNTVGGVGFIGSADVAKAANRVVKVKVIE